MHLRVLTDSLSLLLFATDIFRNNFSIDKKFIDTITEQYHALPALWHGAWLHSSRRFLQSHTWKMHKERGLSCTFATQLLSHGVRKHSTHKCSQVLRWRELENAAFILGLRQPSGAMGVTIMIYDQRYKKGAYLLIWYTDYKRITRSFAKLVEENTLKCLRASILQMAKSASSRSSSQWRRRK